MILGDRGGETRSSTPSKKANLGYMKPCLEGGEGRGGWDGEGRRGQEEEGARAEAGAERED